MTWLWLLCLAWAEVPQVQVETLKSGTVTGAFKSLSSSTLEIEGQKFPLSDVLEVRFDNKPPPAQIPSPIEVQFQDGSRLTGTQITSKGTQVVLSGEYYENATLLKSVLKSVRIQARDSKLEEAWLKLVDRESKKDLLVVRKNDKLDFVPGVAGDIDANTVKFLVDGEEIPVNRERVFGIVFQPAPSTVKPQVVIELANGASVNARQLTIAGEDCQMSLLAGSNLKIPLSQVQSLDFSLGKVKQLSAMVPYDVKYVPMFGDLNEVELWLIQFRKNTGPWSSPLSLNGQIYARGICVHSRTTLKYRLGGEFRRFQSTIGIDDSSDDSGLRGDVHFKISGDGKVLFEADVKGPDDPRTLDLDISGVKELELFVDFGGDLNTADWLSLADAKVLK